jgi:hypothetical protein
VAGAQKLLVGKRKLGTSFGRRVCSFTLAAVSLHLLLLQGSAFYQWSITRNRIENIEIMKKILIRKKNLLLNKCQSWAKVK